MDERQLLTVGANGACFYLSDFGILVIPRALRPSAICSEVFETEAGSLESQATGAFGWRKRGIPEKLDDGRNVSDRREGWEGPRIIQRATQARARKPI